MRTASLASSWKKGSALAWVLPVLFLALFYFYPLGSILFFAFERLVEEGGESLRALNLAYLWRVLRFTVYQAFLSTLLTVLLGMPAAYLFARYEFRGKTLLRALSTIPFVLPTLVVAAAFNALYGPRGWANLVAVNLLGFEEPPFTLTNSLIAILVAHVFYNLTIVIRLVGDYWSRLDPRLSQAGRSLGATPWQAFWKITFPLLLPAILSASLLVFIFDFTSFGVILILGGPRYATLEVEIYYQMSGLLNIPVAVTLSLLQLGCTWVLTIAYNRLSEKVTRPLPLAAQRRVVSRLLKPHQKVFAFLVVAFLVVFQVMPLVALVGRSLTYAGWERGERGFGVPTLSLAAYQEIFINRRASLFYIPPIQAIAISLGYALATLLFSLLIGFPTAWFLARQQGSGKLERLRRWLEPTVLLPLGTSSVTLGLGFILAFSQPPFDLRASPLLIPIAHTLVAFPFVVRSLLPALRSIRPRYHQAAAVLGASPSQIVRRIDLPIVGRAALVAGVFAFGISMGEFGATALLTRPEFPTLPVAIYRFLGQPGEMNYGQAMALSVFLMATTGLGMILIERFRSGEVGEF
ncbi:MAG: iron ABC transporter permease [Anaerolineales bacterium]|nr:iron ABC transporter permease [Anaerolineales bacterium]MCS7247354.1 iron ABC transporter permease [Anaerolineales bacterium]MDW8161165.1 iron ABC transporter permease [Anaerolineales bacterium]MDW8448047.1 iron ABC transporter permease [Anaerolineales bacterium]